jgi:hypothetical protein
MPPRRSEWSKAVIGGALVALGAIGGCVVPGAPSGQRSEPRLEIRGPNHLQVGQQGNLTAWRADGNTWQQRATWSIDGTAASIAPDGTLTARNIGVATVRATANGAMGEYPIDVVPNIAGVWRGSFTIVDCYREQGGGGDPCDQRRGVSQPLVFAISQLPSSSPPEQIDVIVSAQAFAPPASGTFYGVLDGTGTVFLQGSLERVTEYLAAGGVTLLMHLEGNRLESFEGRLVEVGVALRNAGGEQSLRERWRLSPIVRQ